jgi:hypothetical protein
MHGDVKMLIPKQVLVILAICLAKHCATANQKAKSETYNFEPQLLEFKSYFRLSCGSIARYLNVSSRELWFLSIERVTFLSRNSLCRVVLSSGGKTADELGPWAETNGQESGYRSMINSSIRWRNDLMLTMPVKRRWAMVATNPIEE